MSTTHDLEPKLVSVLREGYSRRQLAQDSLAGVVVGIVAFPLAIAFAIASGVRPEQGLFTAIIGGFVISALSGSRVQIGGPTGAFVVLVYGVVARFGYDGLAVATLMAGVLLVAMGLARLGAVIRFVPYAVTVGFTSGIALIIAAGQVRGLQHERVAPLPRPTPRPPQRHPGAGGGWWRASARRTCCRPSARRSSGRGLWRRRGTAGRSGASGSLSLQPSSDL